MGPRYTADKAIEILNYGVQEENLLLTDRKLYTLRKNGLIVPSKDGRSNVYNAVDMMLFAYIRQSQEEGFSPQSRHGFVPKVREHLEATLGRDPEWEDCGHIGFLCSKDHGEIHMVRGNLHPEGVFYSKRDDPNFDLCYHALALFVNYVAKQEGVDVRAMDHSFPKPNHKFFTPKQVKQLVDISYRQMQYWDKSNFINPSYRRRNKFRLYTLLDVFSLDLAQKLRSEGYSIQRLRFVLRQFKPLFYNLSNSGRYTMVVHGNNLLLVHGNLRLDPDKKPFTYSFVELINRVNDTLPPAEPTEPSSS